MADLMDDERFASAVIDDEKCTNSHKLTLLRLWSKAIDYNCGLFNGQAIPANTAPTADTSTAMGCYYPADGSTCPNKDKGACFKTWLKENGHAGR
jgi:hypothetical protein